MNDPTLSQLLAISLINGEEAAEPHGLPQLIPGKHQYVGTLPLKLRHVFVAIEQIRVRELQLKSPTDGSATATSCIIFSREVAKYFNLQDGTEFEICAGFSVARVNTATTSCICHDDAAAY